MASRAGEVEADVGSSRTRVCQTGSEHRGRCHSGSGRSADIAEMILINTVVLHQSQSSDLT